MSFCCKKNFQEKQDFSCTCAGPCYFRPMTTTTTTTTTAAAEKQNRKSANAALYEANRIYWPSLGSAIDLVREILTAHGFNTEGFDGFYCGLDGRHSCQVGPKTWALVAWHKMEVTGNFELTSYVA